MVRKEHKGGINNDVIGLAAVVFETFRSADWDCTFVEASGFRAAFSGINPSSPVPAAQKRLRET